MELSKFWRISLLFNCFFFAFSIFFCLPSQAQTPAITIDSLDLTHTSFLPEITVVGEKSRSDIQQLPEIVGTTIYAGKKNALIVLDNVQGNLMNNTMRQVIAKVPGIHIWESDGSGIQIGIAARGLSPNRSWEFNVRQNGYDISADPYGYPEAYYNPQLQSVQRIELVRGHGALQYGPQFGGMVNYILKNGSNLDKPFQVETEQSFGSFGLFNSYNAIGGKTEKFHYYGFFDHRNADGFRDNSRYHTNSGFGTLTYKPNNKWAITGELMRWNMLSQQAGGLTDSLFAINPETSLRSRNWMDIDWLTMSVILNHYFSESERLNIKIFGIHGDRNSVGFMPSTGILTPDTINTTTQQYANRTVDKDRYRNYGLEARYIKDYSLWKKEHSVSAGLRLYSGSTYRDKGGKGSTGTQADTDAVDTLWNAVIDYKSYNAAAFIENIFRIGNKLSIIPGLRIEYLNGQASGYSGWNNGEPIVLQDQTKNRTFLIAGIGSEFHIGHSTELYANISQAYRPIQFADLTTPPTTDKIDSNLKDAKGYNADIGYRGKLRDYLFFDAGVYYLQYNNRIGLIKQQNVDGSYYNLRTNVGNSRSQGIETMVEINPIKALDVTKKYGDFSIFAAYNLNDSRYQDFKIVSLTNGSLIEVNYTDKYVENAPRTILRSGITYHFKGFNITAQNSYVSKSYTDANNTETPTANGQNGLVPSYSLWDLTVSYRHKEQYTIKAGINNLTDQSYFTRRAGGYPGPGLLPSDGRSFFVSFGIKI